MPPKSLLNLKRNLMIQIGIAVMDTKLTQVILGPPIIESLALTLSHILEIKSLLSLEMLMSLAILINNPCSTIFAHMSKVVIRI